MVILLMVEHQGLVLKIIMLIHIYLEMFIVEVIMEVIMMEIWVVVLLVVVVVLVVLGMEVLLVMDFQELAKSITILKLILEHQSGKLKVIRLYGLLVVVVEVIQLQLVD